MTGSSCNSTKATPNLSGDILGDWREEVILHDESTLYLYTTTIPTEHRIYTLMHDPIYRLGMSWQNTAYNQPPHLGFWLGSGDLPTPDIALTGEDPVPMLIKSGTSIQTVLLGDSIQTVSYTFKNCTSASASGLPSGITAVVSGSSLVISGTPTVAGTFDFTVTTSGGDGDAASMSGTITVVDLASVTTAPASILSLVNAAYPDEGSGAYEEKNAGWIDSGYYNFTNSSDSYGIWKLNSKTATSASMTIRYANGGTAARHMNLVWNGSSIGGVPFATTAAWTTYDSVTVSVILAKGLNTLKLSSMSSDGGPNVDQFEFNVAGVTLWSPDDSTLTDDQDSGKTFIPNIAVSLRPFVGISGDGITYRVNKINSALFVFDLKGKLAFKMILKASEGVVECPAWKTLKPGSYVLAVRSGNAIVAKCFANKLR